MLSTTLAQDGASGVVRLARDGVENLDIINRPDELLDLLQRVPLLGAGVVVVVGALCVINGYRWHKWVVVILAFLGGWVIGRQLSEDFGRSSIVAVALAALCAIIATPMLKFTVAVFGGITGAFIGANVWAAAEASPADAQWAGAAMGFVVLAMMTFLFFRFVIMLFTSIGGAAMVVIGGIALLIQVPNFENAVRDSLSSHELLLPLLVTVAAVGGFVLQHNRNKSAAAEEPE